jgi:hypothetical protein
MSGLLQNSLDKCPTLFAAPFQGEFASPYLGRIWTALTARTASGKVAVLTSFTRPGAKGDVGWEERLMAERNVLRTLPSLRLESHRGVT